MLMTTRSFNILSIASITLTLFSHALFVTYEATRSRMVGYGALPVLPRTFARCA